VTRLRVGVALALLVGVSTALRLWLASRTQAPVIPDEFVYAELAHSFADSRGFEVRGHAISPWSFGPLYPMTIAIAYAVADDAYRAYQLVLTINCVLWSCAAVPAYLLARRLLVSGEALLVAGLSVLVPAGVYTTKVMTESLAYPSFLLACLALLAALERPTLRRQLLALAAIGFAVLARGQLAALAPAYLTAIALVAVAERRPGALRTFWPTLAAAVLGLAALVAMLVRSGGSAMALAGRTTEHDAGIEPVALAASAVRHLALLDLHVGVAPFAGLLVLVAAAVAGGAREHRLFAALALSLVLWLAVVAAAFLAVAPRTSGDAEGVLVFDRYVFYVAPLLFSALLVSLRDRRRRGWPAAAVVAGVLPLTLPYGELLGDRAWGTNTSSVALVPWAILRLGAGEAAVLPAVAAFAAALALGFAAARRRPVLAVAATVSSLVIVGAAAQFANDVSARGGRIAADPTWVDRAVGEDARVVAVRLEQRHATRGAVAVWRTAFFNRSLREVYTLDGGFFRNLPTRRVRPNLSIVVDAPAPPDYALVDGTVAVEGAVVATDPRTGLRLVRTGGAPRLG
jgi:hypothetical protein